MKADRRALRIGVVVEDARSIPIGPLRVLEAISSDVRFSLVQFFVTGSRGRSGGSLFDAAMKIEAGIFARPRGFSASNFERRRQNLPNLFLDTDVSQTVACDVIIDFTCDPRLLDLAAYARFGLWRLSSNDRTTGFYEALNTEPTTPAVLLRYVNKTDPPREIARAAYNTKFMASRNASFVREKAGQLITRELVRLCIAGEPADKGVAISCLAQDPGVGSLVAYGGRLGGAFLGRAIGLFDEKVRGRPVNFILRYGQGGPDDFDPAAGVDFVPHGRHFWADPFLLQHGDETYVFFEDFDYATDRGHISVGRIREGRFEFIGPSLVTKYHLSYPYVFKDGGEIYLIPETYQASRLEIWRLRQFPDKWELCATALDGVLATDSVLTPVNDQLWLFTNISNDSYVDHCSELHLYKVDSLKLKLLEPHPLNPVVIDSRTARGGGRVFRHKDRLLRASQNNSNGVYGYGINLMEIQRLDMENYEETLYRRIDPDFEPGVNGCHHVDFLNGKFVMDMRKDRHRRIGRSGANAR